MDSRKELRRGVSRCIRSLMLALIEKTESGLRAEKWHLGKKEINACLEGNITVVGEVRDKV